MGRGGELDFEIERVAPQALLAEMAALGNVEPSYVRALYTSGGELRTSIVNGTDKSIVGGNFGIAGGRFHGKNCYLSVTTDDPQLYPQTCKAVFGHFEEEMRETENAVKLCKELGNGVYCARVVRRIDHEGEPFYLIVAFLDPEEEQS